MEKIKGIDLAELVQESAAQLLQDARKGAAGQIKYLLQRMEGLARDIKRKQAEVTKLRGKLATTQAKIDKLKSGDWSVLEIESKDNVTPNSKQPI